MITSANKKRSRSLPLEKKLEMPTFESTILMEHISKYTRI